MKRIAACLLALCPLLAVASNIVQVTGNSNVVINGKAYHGNNITINGNNVVVDGKRQDGSLVGPVSVVVQGSADSVSTETGNIQIDGNAGKTRSVSGDIRVKGDIQGDATTTSGNISAAQIKGDAQTVSGDISGRK